MTYQTMEANVRRVRDELQARMRAAPDKQRQHIERCHQSLGEAMVRLELLSIITGEDDDHFKE